MAENKENYRIKLLAGNNVVLVEADKCESEIFTPQIVNGRISFVNIIPNRRCCHITKTNISKSANNVSPESRKHLNELNHLKTIPCERLSAGQSHVTSVPLANSTPIGVKQKSSCAISHSNYSSYVNTEDFSLPTPEPVRKAVPVRPAPFESSMFCLAKGAGMSRIYHNSTEDTPKKFGHIVQPATSSTFANGIPNASVLNDSIRLPCLRSSTSKKAKGTNPLGKSVVDSISRWEKVLTPIRTYTRNSSKAIMIHRPESVNSSAKKILRSSKYKPTYLVNPTKGPNVSQRIEVKKRRIIIDTKICISPRSFKKQKQSLDGNTITTTTTIPNSFGFNKPRRYLDDIGMSAFDLLTNSNRKRSIVRKLNDQFRKGCVNKATSTYNKYKILSTVPPLQQDEEVLEMSNLALLKY